MYNQTLESMSKNFSSDNYGRGKNAREVGVRENLGRVAGRTGCRRRHDRRDHQRDLRLRAEPHDGRANRDVPAGHAPGADRLAGGLRDSQRRGNGDLENEVAADPRDPQQRFSAQVFTTSTANSVSCHV